MTCENVSKLLMRISPTKQQRVSELSLPPWFAFCILYILYVRVTIDNLPMKCVIDTTLTKPSN